MDISENKILTLDILTSGTREINQDFLLNFTKSEYKNVSDDEKRKCKILKISSEWILKELLEEVKLLCSGTLQNLFIIVIEFSKNNISECNVQDDILNIIRCEEYKELLKVLEEFSQNRQMILQCSFKAQNISKFYYKEKNFQSFLEISNQLLSKKSFEDFQSFIMWYMVGDSRDCLEYEVFDELENTKNLSMIIRFLRTLKLEEDFFEALIMECAKFGSSDDLKAAMDFPMNDDYKELSSELKAYFIIEFNEDPPESILYNAVTSKNKKIYEFLIQNFSKMIGQLEHDFLVNASNISLSEDEIEFLTHLIISCDFPFPSNYNPDLIEDENFQKISRDRSNFHNTIAGGDYSKINEFLKENPHLKFAYSPKNISALHQAKNSGNFLIFCHLKSNGYEETNKEKKEIPSNQEMNTIIKQQRDKNFKNAQPDPEQSLKLFLVKRVICSDEEMSMNIKEEYNNKISNWIKDLHTIDAFLPYLEVTAKFCEKIYFHIYFNKVDDLKTFEASAGDKEIHLKIQTKSTDEEIMVDIAKKVGNFTISLCYENDGKPYYKHNKNVEEKLIKADKSNTSHDNDLSEIVAKTKSQDYFLEYFGKMIETYICHDNNSEEINKIDSSYNLFLKFHQQNILLDLTNLNLVEREKIRKFNRRYGIMENIRQSKYEFSNFKNIKELIEDKKVSIIRTNTPKLLHLNIFKYLYNIYGSLIDTKSIFISSENIKNYDIFDELEEIISNNQNLHILIDCSDTINDNIKDLLTKANFTFIFSNMIQITEINCQVLKEYQAELEEKAVNYNWDDLKPDTQKELLKREVIFQHIENKTTIHDLLNKQDSLHERSAVILNQQYFNDTKLLELLIEGNEVTINMQKCAVDKNFCHLLQTRNFIKNVKKMKLQEVISQHKLLDDVKDDKYVLISNVAGSGKSWALKSIVNLYLEYSSQKWITLVDLTELITAFRLSNWKEINFLDFMLQKVLKLQHKFEYEIFKMMYENDQVCILFDGFDEIAPDYTDYVTKLIQSFGSKPGKNQMWITTRDYLELELRETLNLDIVYNLKPFIEENGIDLIVSSWILYDHESTKSSIKTFQEFKEEFPNREDYDKKAADISKKIFGLENNSIGLPLLYKMVAEISKVNKCITIDLTIFNIFAEFVKKYFERWAYDGGDLRADVSVTKQSGYEAKFMELHQYFAMKEHFHKDYNDFRSDISIKNWSDKEIADCGLLKKISDYFVFLHQTIRDFFAVNYITGILSSRDRIENFEYSLQYTFSMYLSNPKYEIVRMFLNDIFGMKDFILKVERNFERIEEAFTDIKKLNDLSGVAEENQINIFSNFLFKLFEKSNPEDVKYLFSLEILIKSTRWPELFFKFLNFLSNYFENYDFFEILMEPDSSQYKEIFIHHLIKYDKSDMIVQTLNLLKEKLESYQYDELLTFKNFQDENILQVAFKYSKDLKTHEILWNLFHPSQESNEEYLRIIKEVDGTGSNLFHKAARFSQNDILATLILRIKEITSFDEINKSLSCLGEKGMNILQIAAFYNHSKEFHECLWDIVRKYLTNKEISDMIHYTNYEPDDSGIEFFAINVNNLLHTVVSNNNNIEIIEYTWNQIERTLKEENKKELRENLLQSKSNSGLNIILNATYNSENIKVLEFCWKLIKDCCKSDEDFLKIITETNDKGLNVLYLSVFFSRKEIFEFTVEKLVEMLSEEDMKNLLLAPSYRNRNFLHISVDIEIYKNLWKIIEKYLDFYEILEMIMQRDNDGDNLLHKKIFEDNVDIMDETWNKIKYYINDKEGQCNFLKSKNHKNMSLLEVCEKRKKSYKLRYWIKEKMREYEIEF